MDVFKLEYADEPQISPDGKRIVYVRNFMDIMKDRQRSNVWIINADGSGHEALTTGNHRDMSPRWSPDGNWLAVAGGQPGRMGEIQVWDVETKKLKLSAPVGFDTVYGVSWSPDGKQIAFAMAVAESAQPFVDMPAKPEGAEWAAPFKMTRKLVYRFDGRG